MSASMTTSRPDQVVLDERSKALRRLVVRGLAGGRRGHVGSAFSLVEILRVLFDEVLRYDAANPRWAGRDRFILSKGHGCLALYALLVDKGFIPATALDSFCKSDGILGGHPEYGKVPGIELSTGSLGHGLPVAVGMALHARHGGGGQRVFVIMGDGESNEGSVWEAALAAGKHRLQNLTVLVDYNKQQSYSTTREVLDLEPLADKWRAFNFGVAEVNGHDPAQLSATLAKLPLTPDRPSCLICHTVKGAGIPFVAGNLEWHHKNRVTDEELTQLLAVLEAT